MLVSSSLMPCLCLTGSACPCTSGSSQPVHDGHEHDACCCGGSHMLLWRVTQDAAPVGAPLASSSKDSWVSYPVIAPYALLYVLCMACLTEWSGVGLSGSRHCF